MSAPRVGTRGVYHSPNNGDVGFEVFTVEGSLCYAKYDNNPNVQPFIWRFKEGPNALHDWKGKDDSGSQRSGSTEKLQGSRGA